MRRCDGHRGRPIAAGRLRPATACVVRSVAFCRWRCLPLRRCQRTLKRCWQLFTLMSYLLVYTPLKRKTPLCTFVGAVPGAMPTLIGWAAASGSISSGKAWILYAVLFLWQFPHFMAIAWMYREDYARAGYLIFPTEAEDRFLIWMTAVPALALFVAGLCAVAAGGGSMFQYSATVLLGLGLLYCAIRQILIRSRIVARQLLKATILYLPLQFVILLLRKG